MSEDEVDEDDDEEEEDEDEAVEAADESDDLLPLLLALFEHVAGLPLFMFMFMLMLLGPAGVVAAGGDGVVASLSTLCALFV